MSTDKGLELPETVRFDVGGRTCIAYVAFGKQYGMDMRTCTRNYGETKPSVHLEYLPHAARVKINGNIWFDCHPDKAAEIEALFAQHRTHRTP